MVSTIPLNSTAKPTAAMIGAIVAAARRVAPSSSARRGWLGDGGSAHRDPQGRGRDIGAGDTDA